MPHIVIVGDRESGKTTFLALLYAAQVKSGSDRSDAFRFHAAFDSLDEISDAFQQLMSGSFPDAAVKEGIRGMTFHVDYRKSGLGLLSRLRSGGWTAGAPASLRFVLLRNLDEEMTRFRRGSSLANATLRDVLESEAVAILVDSSKLAGKGEESPPGPMSRYDEALETLLTILQRSGAGGSRPLHPLFIFSKFDSASPEGLRAAKVEGDPPGVRKTGPRAAYARALLNHTLPRTMARVAARDPRGRRFATPRYFFSSVRTEPAATGERPRIRLRRSGAAGWEPDYSADEYLALLESFWKIGLSAGA